MQFGLMFSALNPVKVGCWPLDMAWLTYGMINSSQVP